MRFTFHTTLLALFLSGSARGALPGDDAIWKPLTEKPVPVECTEIAGTPWCRSTGVVHAPLASVSKALQNMRNNANIFQSVVKIDVLSGDSLRVVLDYPAPLDDRDYVAHYTFTQDGDAHVFAWKPTKHPDAPEEAGIVRLPNFEGEWRLQPHPEGTLVRYLWQAEINGSFPAFGYNQAWKKAGMESLTDLANTQKAELSAP